MMEKKMETAIMGLFCVRAGKRIWQLPSYMVG